MGATRNTGYLENLIQYDASDNVAIATSVNPSYKVTLGGSMLGTSAVFSGNLSLQGAVTRNINFYDSSNTNINAQIQYDQISSNSGQLFFGTNNAGTFATRLTISNTGKATFSSDIQGGGDLYFSKATRTTIYPTTTNQNLHIKSNGTGTLQFNDDVTGNIAMVVGGGKVGIGTTNPEELLELSSSNTTGGQFLMESTGSTTGNYAGMRFKIAGGSDGGYEKAGIFAVRGSGGYNDLSLVFATNTAATTANVTTSDERMRITSGGNVGIGTTDPKERFEVVANWGNIRLYGRAGINLNNISNNIYYNGSSWVRDNGSYGAQKIVFDTDGDLIFETTSSTSGDATPRMTITGGGRVDFTEFTRAQLYQIYKDGAYRGGLYNYINASGGGSDYSTSLVSETAIYFCPNGSSARAMTITSGGNVMINTTSDNGYRLNVSGNIYASSSIVSNSWVFGQQFATTYVTVSGVGTSFVNSGITFPNTTATWLVSIQASGDGNMYSSAMYVVTAGAWSKTLALIGGPSNHFGNGTIVAQLNTSEAADVNLQVRRTTSGSATVTTYIMKIG